MTISCKQSLTTVVSILIFSIGLFSQAGSDFTLQDAIDFAIANNVEVKNAQLAIADAEQQINERRATGLPQIDADVGYDRYLQVPASVLPSAFEELIRLGNGGELPDDFSRRVSFFFKHNFTAGVNLRSMIFDGSYFTGIKAAKLYREYAREDLKARQQSVKNSVVQAYLPVLIVEKNLEIIDKNIKNVQDLLFNVKASYQEGFVEQLDVDRLELSLANLEVEKENLDRQKEVAINFLKLTLNYPGDKDLKPVDDLENLLTPVRADLLDGNINYYNRLEYKVAETGLQLNDVNVDYNRSFYLPTLSLNAAYNQTYQGNQLFGDPQGFWAPTALVGLSLKIPIFDGLDKKSKIERARLEREIAQNQLDQLADVIDTEVINARIQYKSAQKRLQSQEKNLQLAEKIYNTTQIKYNEGVGTSLELNQAEGDLYQTQRNYTQAMYDLLVAKMDLEIALGL